MIAYEPARVIGNAQARHDPWAGTDRFQWVNEFGIVDIVEGAVEPARWPIGDTTHNRRSSFLADREPFGGRLGHIYGLAGVRDHLQLLRIDEIHSME